jgi:hypothetical protein
MSAKSKKGKPQRYKREDGPNVGVIVVDLDAPM